MKYIDTAIPDVKIIEPQVFGDERGFFMETFRTNEFSEQCAAREFVQENHSRSRQGILRGLHYQLKQTYDVAVDMRRSSPTFGKWVGVELSAENKRQLWVPEGFAHGFYVTTETAEFVYKCTDYYAPEHECSLKWDDKTVGINWPLVDGKAPDLSGKDEDGASWETAEFFD